MERTVGKVSAQQWPGIAIRGQIEDLSEADPLINAITVGQHLYEKAFHSTQRYRGFDAIN